MPFKEGICDIRPSFDLVHSGSRTPRVHTIIHGLTFLRALKTKGSVVVARGSH